MADPTKPRGRLTQWLTLAVGLVAMAGWVTGAVGEARQARQARGHHTVSPSAEAKHAGHETTDIDVRGVAFILAGFAATAALVVGIVFVMIWHFHVSQHQSWARLTPQEITHVAPPPPRLEVNPLAVIQRHVAEQQHLLTSYGWTSADHATARIPIARAMALIVGKSLDVHP